MNEENIKEIIVKELRISHLPLDAQEKITHEVYTLCMNQALMLLVKELPREDLGGLTELLEQGKYEEVRIELFKHIPNAHEILPDILNNAVKAYKNLLLSNTE